MSHGHDELCQELPCLALYICDNFLSGEAGEATMTNGFSYRFQAQVVRPSCGLHSPFLRLFSGGCLALSTALSTCPN